MLKRLTSYDDLVSMRKAGEKKLKQDKVKVYICMTGCRALGAEEVYDEFRKQIKKQKLTDKVKIIETGCQGLCARAPVMTINPPGDFSHRRIFYGRVTADIVPDIISSTVLKGEVINKLCYAEAGKKIPYLKDIPFYSKQKKIVLRNCGIIDPKNVEHYIARKGYEAFAMALLNVDPNYVINEITRSGLRGVVVPGSQPGLSGNFVERQKVILNM